VVVVAVDHAAVAVVLAVIAQMLLAQLQELIVQPKQQ
jgi:hypothetical protein